MSNSSIRENGRRKRSSTENQSPDHHDRWLISYADLITLLFALFVVLYAAADKERAERIEQAITSQFGYNDEPSIGVGGQGVLPGSNSLINVRSSIDNALAKNTSLRSAARVTSNERGITISLAEAGFFSSGEAIIRDDAVSMIDALAEALRGSELPLRIEGHTDSTPISNSRYRSNWELSTARASAVLKLLIQKGLPSSNLSIAGYAGEKPIADNNTPEGRALNRRVDLVVVNSKLQ
jgi:chemotaxis protein MotB